MGWNEKIPGETGEGGGVIYSYIYLVKLVIKILVIQMKM